MGTASGCAPERHRGRSLQSVEIIIRRLPLGHATPLFQGTGVSHGLCSVLLPWFLSPLSAARRGLSVRQAAEHPVYPRTDDHGGKRRSLSCHGQPRDQNAEHGSAARRGSSLHRLPRQPDLLADALGADDRPSRVPQWRHAHDSRARADGALDDDDRPSAQVGRLHNRHFRQMAPRRRTRISAESPRLRRSLHSRGRRHRAKLSRQLRRRPGKLVLRSDDSPQRHLRENARLLHGRVLRSSDPLDRIGQREAAVLLLSGHQCPARAAGRAREIRDALRRKAQESQDGQVLRDDREHRREYRPPAAKNSRSGTSTAIRSVS